MTRNIRNNLMSCRDYLLHILIRRVARYGCEPVDSISGYMTRRRGHTSFSELERVELLLGGIIAQCSRCWSGNAQRLHLNVKRYGAASSSGMELRANFSMTSEDPWKPQ